MTVNWKFFSLEQVNSQQGPDWKIWEQPDDYPSRGMRAFRAAQAARNQGEAAFISYHMPLINARHEQRRDIADINTLLELAGNANLDIKRFKKDLDDRQLLNRLADDHTGAIDTLGIFGTPTLVFPEKQAVFLKMSTPPSPEDSLSVFTEIRQLAEQRRNIQEIKRPVRPNK